MITGQTELGDFLDRSTKLFEGAFFNWLHARFQKDGNAEEGLRELALLLQRTLILADMHGRRRTLMEADHIRRLEREGRFAELPDRTPISYGVTFEEALDDLLTREPRLAQSAAEVARLYSTEQVFAMARSASMKLTERVKQAIADLIQSGEATGRTNNEILRAAIENSHDWTRAYAATVYRTNISTAYNNGRFQQAKDPDVQQAIRALEVVGVADDRERPNHRAARGLIAATVDPIWSRAKPPYGFQCRHSIAFVSRFELERRGLLRPDGSVIRREPPGFAAFRPDEGFRAGEF